MAVHALYTDGGGAAMDERRRVDPYSISRSGGNQKKPGGGTTEGQRNSLMRVERQRGN
jgi:hypothetical protein